MTQTSDELRRQVVTLLQQSADLKIEAQRLLKAANELRHNAARCKTPSKTLGPKESVNQ